LPTPAPFAGSRPFEAASGAGAEIVDPHGRVIAASRPAASSSPTRHEIRAGDILFPLRRDRRPAQKIALGAWWMEEGIVRGWCLSFAMRTVSPFGVATRVAIAWMPPELEQSRHADPRRRSAGRLLVLSRHWATRSVVPKDDGFRLRWSGLPHQNEIAARRGAPAVSHSRPWAPT
jgi:hypothetical protein